MAPFNLASNDIVEMTDTIQINPDLRILSYVSPWWTECYAHHLQNITLTSSLSFHLLRRSRKPTHSVPALLSYVLSIPRFLLSEVSPGQFLLGSCGGSKEDPRPRSAGEVRTSRAWGYTACVRTESKTYTHLSPRETRAISVRETLLRNVLSAFLFLLFFSLCNKGKHTDLVKCSE